MIRLVGRWFGGVALVKDRGLRGRAEVVVLVGPVCQSVVFVGGCAGPLEAVQVISGRDRIRSSAVWKLWAHGQRAGSRSVHRRLRLTSRPGRASSRVRTCAGSGELMVGVDLTEAGGPTDHVVGQNRAREPAALAKNRPEGQWSRPAPSLRSWMASSTGGVVPVELVGIDGQHVDVGDERVVLPVGSELRLGGIGEPGSTHDKPNMATGPLRAAAGHVGRLRDLRPTAVGVDDVDPVGLINGGDRLADAGFMFTVIDHATPKRVSWSIRSQS